MSDSEDEQFKSQLKMCFIGDSNTGKTSLIHRYCEDSYPSQHDSTIGVDFFLHDTIVVCEGENQGKCEIRISLKICDVGGQAIKGHMLDSYLHSSNIVVLVYDVTNSKSFDTLATWIKFALENVGEKTTLAVVGNKCDLEHQRSVRLDKTHSFCEKYNIKDYLVSAKNGEGVVSAFHNIIAMFFKMKPVEERSQMMIQKSEPKLPRENGKIDNKVTTDESSKVNELKMKSSKKRKAKYSAICVIQ